VDFSIKLITFAGINRNLMNEFFNPLVEPFEVGRSDLTSFRNPCRIDWGMVLVCAGGTAVVSIDLISFDIGRYMKVSLLPGTVFTLVKSSADFEVMFICFSQGLLDEAVFRLEPSFCRFLHVNPVYEMPECQVDVMLSCYRLLTAVYNDRANRFRVEIIRNMLQCMFWETYDKTFMLFEHLDDRSVGRYREIFRRFIELIYSHYREQRGVGFYAAQLCITPHYLSLITRSIAGKVSAKELINRHVIIEIKVMLQSGQLPVQVIADRLNFPDQSNLCRYFKRYAGMSPMEYRLSVIRDRG